MKDARVVDPAEQPDRDRIFFGAIVTYVDEEDRERKVVLVGQDETDPSEGRISWDSPIGRALRGAKAGDLRRVMLPAGEQELEVLKVEYPG